DPARHPPASAGTRLVVARRYRQADPRARHHGRGDHRLGRVLRLRRAAGRLQRRGRALAPLVVGQDPTRIEHLTQQMHHALMIWGRRGLAMFALSGVELALWDIAGKARAVPVYQLLGGLCRPRTRVYASLLRYDTATDVRQAVSVM